MQKILITGGAGYIGSFMVRELQSKGFEPVILDNLSQGHKESVKDFRLEVIDLVTQKDKLDEFLASEKFDGVIHMASFIQMGESYTDPQKYYINNVIGFINLLGAMVKNSVGKIILSSSAGVYGNPVKVPMKTQEHIYGYCMKCRAKAEIKNPHHVTMKNRRHAIQGSCSRCGTKMFRFRRG